MGGGDLNLKKSWHTGLLSNQRKVWEAEQNAIAERKKIEQVRREREEERQMEEIAKLQEASGGPTKQNRVDWMYSGAANASGTAPAEEMEAFLLGKRRVDALLTAEDSRQTEKAAAVPADTGRDLASKVAMDPLLLIERQKQEDMEKAVVLRAKIEERQRRHEKDSKRRRKERRSRRSRSRDRSRSPRHERRRERGRHEEPHRRHRVRDRNEDRSHQPRSDRSPRRRARSMDNSEGDRDRGAARYNATSSGLTERNGRHGQRQQRDLNSEDRAAKLAAMKADADNLEADRSRRLAAIEQRDAEERKREDRERFKGGNFKANLYDGVDLAGRLKGIRNSAS